MVLGTRSWIVLFYMGFGRGSKIGFGKVEISFGQVVYFGIGFFCNVLETQSTMIASTL